MKKIAVIISICFLLIVSIVGITYSYQETFELQFKVLDIPQNEQIDLYILLRKEYIEYIIEKDGLEIPYEGPETLIKNNIPSLSVKKENIKEEIYEEDGNEYVQILLEKNIKDIYTFDIVKDYYDMDMCYRIKNEKKDYIAHIENFKVREDICEIEYNYEEDTLKQPGAIVITTATKILIIILIILVLIGTIAYLKKRGN